MLTDIKDYTYDKIEDLHEYINGFLENLYNKMPVENPETSGEKIENAMTVSGTVAGNAVGLASFYYCTIIIATYSL